MRFVNRMIGQMIGAGFVLGVLALGQTAFAEGIIIGGKTSKEDIFRKQAALLDGRLAKQYESSVRLTPKGKELAAEDISLLRYTGSYKGEYLATAQEAARKHNIPEDLFLRLVQRESGWDIAAVSPKGASGLAQLMPDTAEMLGVDINDPAQNLEGGARYLRMMYDRFGSWRLALAAYNAGPAAVEEAGGIPEFEETQDYVAAILG